jgi:hypothetical protein|tara:strand:+ start:156 stop:407 length:252 start_codon:yes stop_codon:yes gene_type:complete
MEEAEIRQQYRNYILAYVKEHPGGFGAGSLAERVQLFGVENRIGLPELSYAEGIVNELVEERKIEVRNIGSKRYPTQKLYLND